MRKHNEGYTLPLVLVVFLVLSLVVVTVLTVAVNNLHGQKVSIQRMEEQYTAQGAVEAVVARLPYEASRNTHSGESADKVITDLVAKICEEVSEDSCTISGSDPNYTTGDDNAFDYYVTLTSGSGSLRVISRIKLSGQVAVMNPTVTPGEPAAQAEQTLLVTITQPTVSFESYRFATIAETEAETDE